MTLGPSARADCQRAPSDRIAQQGCNVLRNGLCRVTHEQVLAAVDRQTFSSQ
jgi:hypothetical protein